MKLIQALKLKKELLVKADDLRAKVGAHSAHLNIETAPYKEQAKQVRTWLTQHESIMQEIGNLTVLIAKTNLATLVPIKLGDKVVTKCITEWIVRRKELAGFDQRAWGMLTDRGLKESDLKTAADSPVTQIRIVRCFDPLERDAKVSLFKAEPNIIDATLEVTNAVTDLVEA